MIKCEPVLSTRAPSFIETERGVNCLIEVENFGQVASANTTMSIEGVDDNGKTELIASGKVKALQPYEKTELSLSTKFDPSSRNFKNYMVTLYNTGKKKIGTETFSVEL